MKIIDNLKRPFRAILLALGLTVSVASLTGCGSNGHEKIATQKAIDIIEDATEHIEKRNYAKLEDDLNKAEELVEHSDRLENEGDTKDIASETEKAIYSAKAIIDNSTGVSTTNNSIVGSIQGWYGSTQAESEWLNLQSIVMNVEQWPEDMYGEYYTAMDGLYTAVGNAIGRDSKEEIEEAKDAAQEKDGSKIEDAIEAGAEKAGETVGKAHNAFVNGLQKAAEENSKNQDGTHDYVSREQYEKEYRKQMEKEVQKDVAQENIDATQKAYDEWKSGGGEYDFIEQPDGTLIMVPKGETEQGQENSTDDDDVLGLG